MLTFAYPSVTKRSRAAARISSRSSCRNLSRRAVVILIPEQCPFFQDDDTLSIRNLGVGLFQVRTSPFPEAHAETAQIGTEFIEQVGFGAVKDGRAKRLQQPFRANRLP